MKTSENRGVTYYTSYININKILKLRKKKKVTPMSHRFIIFNKYISIKYSIHSGTKLCDRFCVQLEQNTNSMTALYCIITLSFFVLFNCARSLECRMSKDHHRHCWCRELLHHHLVLHRVIGIYLNVRKFIQLLDGPQSACQSQLNWRKLTNVFMNPNLHRENDFLPYTPLDPSPPSSIHLLFCLSWLILRQLPKQSHDCQRET